MSDLAAKRMEVRRRKILEKSEDRLKRITGLYSSGTDTSTNSENAYQEALSTSKKHLLPSSAEVDSIKSTEIPVNRTFQRADLDPPSSSKYKPVTNDSLWQHRDHEIDDKKEPTLYPHHPQEPEQPVEHPLIKIRLHVIVLAVIVRILLSTPFSFLVGKSAVVPFFTLEFVDIFCGKRAEEDLKGNSGLFVATLALSGIPYRRIKHVTKTLSVFRQLFEDFCIYFVLFVLTHVFLEILS